MFFSRNITDRLMRAIEQSPVTLLLGPRQVGKTTLVKKIAIEKNYTYVTFDDFRVLAAVKEDPIGFLEHYKSPVIFDEIQRAPELFLSIKQIVDADRKPGMFILTGSANPLIAPKIADSLAGRMYIIPLWPLSQGEIHNHQEQFVNRIFSPTFQIPTEQKSLSRDEWLTSLIKGGYPSIQSGQEADEWYSSYLSSLLQRDVQDLANIEGLSALPNLLLLLATRTSGLINMTDLSSASKLPTSTLNRYFALLEALFLVYRQPAWSEQLSKRLIKSPKFYFVDTGIAAFLLNANVDRIKNNPSMIGSLFENFVVSEIVKQVSWSQERISCYHFRTQSNAEVDLVLENKQGNIVGIEMKSSQTISGDDFKGLRHLAEVAGDKFLRGFVVYTGNVALPFGKNMMALPLSVLWD